MALPSGIIVGWPSTAASIPSGFSRVTAMDGRIPKGAAAYGGTGGSANHDHTTSGHTHTAGHSHSNVTSGACSGSTNVQSGATVMPTNAHTHTVSFATDSTASASDSGNTDLANNYPARYSVIWIQSNGTADLPSGAVAWLQGTSVPAGFDLMDGTGDQDMNNRFFIGAAGGADGGTASAADLHNHTYTHSHSGASHSHTLSTGSASASTVRNAAVGTPVANGAHVHNTSGSSDANSSNSLSSQAPTAANTASEIVPAHTFLYHVRATATGAVPANIIAIWSGAAGSIPGGWNACDGTSGTPNLNGSSNPYIRGTTSGAAAGTTGSSAASHDHGSISHSGHSVDAHTHDTAGTLGNGSGSQQSPASTNAIATQAHTHTVPTSGAVASPSVGSGAPTTGTTAPEAPFAEVIFIMAAAVDKASSENAAINVTEGDTVASVQLIDSTENAAINATEADSIAASLADSENAAINVTEIDTVGIPANSSENAALNVTETDVVQVYGDFPPRRIRVETYDASDTLIAEGPVVEALECRYRYLLDEIGAYEFTCPATVRNSQALAEGGIVRIFREGEGLCFIGVIDKVQIRIANEQPVLVVSGSSIARQLVWLNTKFARAFEGTSLASTASTLLTGTGWAAGTLGTPTNNAFTRRFDSVPIWPSLVSVATAATFHVRENPWDKQVDIDALGTDSGIVFQNVSGNSPELEANTDLFPIKTVQVLRDAMDVWNSIEPVGAGEGINRLTLKMSTRTTPYTIQNEAQPDGQLRYFIEDSASVTAYGKRELALLFKDVQPLSLSPAGFQAAADTLYDVATTWLQRHKDSLRSYQVGISGFRHINLDGSRRLMPGDKVTAVYHGVATDDQGDYVWLNLNQSLWVMAMERAMKVDGSDDWKFTVSTADRFEQDDSLALRDALNNIRTIAVAPRPFTYREVHGPFRNSVDASFPIQLLVNYDSNVYLVHQAKLTFTIRGLRSNASGAASGGGTTSSAGSSHSHSVSGGTSADGGGSHSHSVSGQGAQAHGAGDNVSISSFAFVSSVTSAGPSTASTGLQSAQPPSDHDHSMQSHTHSVTAPAFNGTVSSATHTHSVTGATSGSADITHSHSFSGSTSGAEASHTHTVSAHTHAVSFGITQQSAPGAMAVTVTINGVDRTAALGGPWNASQTLDITTYLIDANGQPLRQDNVIQLGASQLGDLEITVRSMVTATSLVPV